MKILARFAALLAAVSVLGVNGTDPSELFICVEWPGHPHGHDLPIYYWNPAHEAYIWHGADCSGTAESAKFTLDQCTNGGSSYSKFSLSGSTYTINIYAGTDTTCTGNSVTVSGAADACLTFAGAPVYVKVLSGSAHLSGAATSEDCTSGTCVTDTGNSACERSPVPLSMRIDLSFPSRSRLHRNHVRLPWPCGSLDRIRLDS